MPENPIQFVKMHGAGNDYVYIDCFSQPAPENPGTLAKRMADRHRGVGGDGLILVQPSGVAAARMRMFNADGSEAEMCGNGVRCVGHLVVARGHAGRGHVTIETGRGVLTLDVTPTGERISRVRVDMGPPILDAESIPVIGARGPLMDAPCPALGPEEPWWVQSGLDPRMSCVSMGNPHLVLFCAAVDRVPLEQIGPRLEQASLFPRRINVHFVQVLAEDRVRVRTWERGSGPTLACGTGAAAVCVTGASTGRTVRSIVAELPGGDLQLDWTSSGNVFLTGPAEEVFVGTWPADVADESVAARPASMGAGAR
jgi:diaminopimelate epimerase